MDPRTATQETKKLKLRLTEWRLFRLHKKFGFHHIDGASKEYVTMGG